MREEETVVEESPSDPSDPPEHQARPRLWTLFALLGGVALVFSYLGAYAVVNVLVTTEVIDRWPVGSDPRPRWMLHTFLSLVGAFTATALLFNWSNRRHMRSIDAMDASD